MIPALEREPESASYPEGGEGFPPALDNADTLVEYESRLRVLRVET